MSRDNWERLVAAVVRKEQLWQLFHQQSRSPSINSVSSDDATGDNPNSTNPSPSWLSPSSLSNWCISHGGEHTSFRSTQPTNKPQFLDCESSDVFSASPVRRISILRSIDTVLIKAKITLLLPFGPLAILLHYFTQKQEWAFFCSLIGLIPLVERFQYATEQLTFCIGPTVGELVRATIGNTTEMIISIYALKNGMISIVKQYLVGIMLSNMLLLLGCASFCGGIVHLPKAQKYNKATAATNSGLLLIAIMALLFPTLLHFVAHTEVMDGNSEILPSEIALSRFSSCVMLFAYAISLVFQLNTRSDQYKSLDEAMEDSEDEEEGRAPEICHWEAVGWLGILAFWISVLSECLVDTIQDASDTTNIPVAFIGVILVPFVANAGRLACAIVFAMEDEFDGTLGVAISTSSQISMLVIPFCVTLGWMLGEPMDLNLPLLEAATLLITVFVVAVMFQEGQSNYFKGLMLIMCYLIVAATFFVHIDPSYGTDP